MNNYKYSGVCDNCCSHDGLLCYYAAFVLTFLYKYAASIFRVTEFGSHECKSDVQ
jgi:hypothetical protein